MKFILIIFFMYFTIIIKTGEHFGIKIEPLE